MLLLLAVLGAAVVCIPLTRIFGLGLVAALAVPVAVLWHRERGNAGRWAATAALGVLGAAFLVGGVVTLVDIGVLAPGSPRWAVNLPPDELTQAPGPDDPDDRPPSGPEAGSPTTPLPGLPPGAARTPAKPAPTAANPAARRPTQTVTKPVPTTARRRDEPAPDRQGRSREDEDSSPTATSTPPPDNSCQLGAIKPNADGSYMVCAQPDSGGYTWQRAESQPNEAD